MGYGTLGEIGMVWLVFCAISWEYMAMRMVLFDLVGLDWIMSEFFRQIWNLADKFQVFSILT